MTDHEMAKVIKAAYKAQWTGNTLTTFIRCLADEFNNEAFISEACVSELEFSLIDYASPGIFRYLLSPYVYPRSPEAENKGTEDS